MYSYVYVCVHDAYMISLNYVSVYLIDPMMWPSLLASQY